MVDGGWWMVDGGTWSVEDEGSPGLLYPSLLVYHDIRGSQDRVSRATTQLIVFSNLSMFSLLFLFLLLLLLLLPASFNLISSSIRTVNNSLSS